MRYPFVSIIALICSILLITACNRQSETDKLDKTPYGLPYKTLKKGNGPAPEIGNLVSIYSIYKTANDSVFASGYEPDVITQQFKMEKATQYGDLLDMFSVMHEGDSTEFYLQSDSVYQGLRPPYIHAGDVVKIIIKMEEVALDTGQAGGISPGQQDQLQIDTRLIQNYLAKNNLTGFEKVEDGVFYRIDKKGKGENLKAGQNVKMHYILENLQGKKIDATYDRGEPITVTLGIGQLILGWEEGLRYFNVGSSGELIIPSPLAYGEQGQAQSNIEPNEILVFKIEIIGLYDEVKQLASDAEKIRDYLARGSIKAKQTKEGVYYKITKKGKGPKPESGQTMIIDYTGRLLDGTVFDSSIDRDQPFSFVLGAGQVIQGWEIGLQYFNKGSKGLIFIPSTLAYRDHQVGNIPPNSVLIFDVQVLDIQ